MHQISHRICELNDPLSVPSSFHSVDLLPPKYSENNKNPKLLLNAFNALHSISVNLDQANLVAFAPVQNLLADRNGGCPHRGSTASSSPEHLG